MGLAQVQTKPTLTPPPLSTLVDTCAVSGKGGAPWPACRRRAGSERACAMHAGPHGQGLARETSKRAVACCMYYACMHVCMYACMYGAWERGGMQAFFWRAGTWRALGMRSICAGGGGGARGGGGRTSISSGERGTIGLKRAGCSTSPPPGPMGQGATHHGPPWVEVKLPTQLRTDHGSCRGGAAEHGSRHAGVQYRLRLGRKRLGGVADFLMYVSVHLSHKKSPPIVSAGGQMRRGWTGEAVVEVGLKV